MKRRTRAKEDAFLRDANMVEGAKETTNLMRGKPGGLIYPAD